MIKINKLPEHLLESGIDPQLIKNFLNDTIIGYDALTEILFNESSSDYNERMTTSAQVKYFILHLDGFTLDESQMDLLCIQDFLKEHIDATEESVGSSFSEATTEGLKLKITCIQVRLLILMLNEHESMR